MANRRTPDTPTPADPVSPTEPRSAQRAPAPRARKSPMGVPPVLRVTPQARRALIAEHAYLRAERRGFAPGHETDDWLAAEVEVDALLKVEHGGSPQ